MDLVPQYQVGDFKQRGGQGLGSEEGEKLCAAETSQGWPTQGMCSISDKGTSNSDGTGSTNRARDGAGEHKVEQQMGQGAQARSIKQSTRQGRGRIQSNRWGSEHKAEQCMGPGAQGREPQSRAADMAGEEDQSDTWGRCRASFRAHVPKGLAPTGISNREMGGMGEETGRAGQMSWDL